VLAPKYKQHILSLAEGKKLCYLLAELCQICLFEFILVQGGATFMKYFKAGRKLRKFGNL
jgi:hypothetical protein